MKFQKQKPIPKLLHQEDDQLIISARNNTFTFACVEPFDEIVSPYVYFVFRDNILLYIGKGRRNRWQHTMSLESHNPFIVKSYKDSLNDKCQHRTFIVDSFDTDSAAYYKEENLIRMFKPLGNIVHNPRYPNSKKGARILAQNYVQWTEVANGVDWGRTMMKAREAIKRARKARAAWLKENENSLIDERLDTEHLNWLSEQGIY